MDTVRKSTAIGAIVTLVAMLLLMVCFWGPGWFAHWRTNFLNAYSEDYIKDLYTTTWHSSNDISVTQCGAMNYPHGEYYVYTGLHPLISVPLQWAAKAGVEHTERAVLPLMNLFVMLSVLLCALFLYLIFRNLKLPIWYAVVAALLVTLMSPQLQRMGGHISLSYYCVIPMLLWFSLQHMHTGHWGWSLAMGVMGFLCALCHPYYFVFFVVVALSDALFILIPQGERPISQCLTSAIHLLLAVVLPSVVFWVVTHVGLSDDLRTNYPSGFFRYQGSLPGLLLPYGRPYFFEDGHLFGHVEWEARSYVGIVALVFICYLLVRLVQRIFLGRGINVNPRLFFLFVSAALLAVYAIGFPIDLLPRNSVTYLGPLAQFRASGRFLWLFYYVVNIVALYYLYLWQRNRRRERNNNLRRYCFVLLLLLFVGEAVAYNVRNRAWYNGSWDVWTDYDNKLPENRWVGDIDASSYQAILTLPVFNYGSELITVPDKDDMFRTSAWISMKTGLPLVCQESTRSVLLQSWQCMALGRPAFDTLRIADQFPDSRPLLLAVSPDIESLNSEEQLLLSHAVLLMELPQASLWSLPVEALHQVVDETRLFLDSCWRHTDSIQTDQFVWNTDTVYGDIHKWTTVYDGLLFAGDKDTVFTSPLSISLWIYPVLQDQYSRTDLVITAFDKDGNATKLYGWSMDHNLLLIDERRDEGLFSLEVELPENCCRIQIKARNPMMRSSPVRFRNLLIRPACIHSATNDADRLFFDNIPIIQS